MLLFTWNGEHMIIESEVLELLETIFIYKR